MNEWKDIVKNPPHKWDGDSMGNILVWYSNTERAGIDEYDPCGVVS